MNDTTVSSTRQGDPLRCHQYYPPAPQDTWNGAIPDDKPDYGVRRRLMRKTFPLDVPPVVTRALRSDSETRVRILRAQRAPPNPVIPVLRTATSNSHAEAVSRLRGCQRYRFLMFVGPLTSSSCFEAVMVLQRVQSQTARTRLRPARMRQKPAVDVMHPAVANRSAERRT